MDLAVHYSCASNYLVSLYNNRPSEGDEGSSSNYVNAEGEERVVGKWTKMMIHPLEKFLKKEGGSKF